MTDTQMIFGNQSAEFQAVFAEEAAMVDASELIAEALERSGMTRTQLAKALNVSKSEVTARLAGERNITVRNLAKTLHVLGATLELGVAEGKKAQLESHKRPMAENA